MIASRDLQLVLVTPETTLLNQPVKSLRFQLFDGQIGVLPGRAPLVGRLGTGELKFDLPNGTSEVFYIEGGFVQIKGSVVTLLTSRSLPVAKIDLAKAEADLAAALASAPTDAAGRAHRAQVIERNKKMIHLKTR